MKIVIETIPQDHQRYPTCGDYWKDPDGTLQVRVSAMGNSDYEWLVAVHELIEQKLTEKAGITNEQIDAFDMGIGADLDEPGEDDRAPYHKQHMTAYGIEIVLSAELGVSWSAYADAVETAGGEEDD